MLNHLGEKRKVREMFPLTVNPRSVRATDFPTNGTQEEQWCFLVNYALLAPSEYNTQPWLFRVHDNSLELSVDSTRSVPVVDPEGRELLISCGAAICNLRLALRHFGYLARVESHLLKHYPDLIVRLSLGEKEPATSEEERLFAAIPLRHTNRSLYEDRPVPADTLERMKTLAGHEGAWLEVIQKAPVREAITDLIVAGDQQQWADRCFREELAQWIHPRETTSTDGLPGAVNAKGSIHEMTSPFIVRTFDLWKQEAARDRQLIAGAPVLLALGTFADTPEDWFSAGMATEQVLLEACASGLQTSFVKQPIEVPSLRGKLQQLLARQDYPQLLIRAGYAEKTTIDTPRRCVQDVLIQEEK